MEFVQIFKKTGLQGNGYQEFSLIFGIFSGCGRSIPVGKRNDVHFKDNQSLDNYQKL